jgi:TetR/AcrR family transcriptional regulator, regulator of biofilm formation and stress response
MIRETVTEPTDRERRLLQATLRIIGRSGIDAVTHRAVALEAGVSVGAVTYHFGTRDGLVIAALEQAVSREVHRLRALALELQSKAFDVAQWIDTLVNWYARDLASDAETHIACYEAFLAAARSARHRPLITEWFETWRQSAELALRAAGSSSPRSQSEIFISAFIGIVLRQLAVPRRRFKAETKAILTQLVGILVGPRG